MQHCGLDGAESYRTKAAKTLSSTLTLCNDNVLFIVEPPEFAIGLARRRVTVCNYPDGGLEIQYDGVTLPHRTFDKLQSMNPC